MRNNDTNNININWKDIPKEHRPYIGKERYIFLL